MSAYANAVITGASRGIGRALAIALAARGVRDIALVARGAEALGAVAAEVERAGARARIEVLDVGDAEATADRMRSLDDALGGLELVVANAGVGAGPTADPIAWETLRDPFHVNFCGAAATLTAALPRMVARRRGHLVGIGSLSAYGALPGAAAYCTPKAGLGMLLDCLRLDLAGTGVAVTHARLGFVRTSMVAQSTHPMPQLLEADEVGRELARRLPSRPREIVMPRALALATRALAALPQPMRELIARAGRRSA